MENRRVSMNRHTNLLQLEEHMYPLVDVATPNVFRNLFPYSEVPKLHSTTESFHIICQMISGSPTRHSVMASSPEHHTALSRS